MFVSIATVSYAQSAAVELPKKDRSFFSNPEKRTPCIIGDDINQDNFRVLRGNYIMLKHDNEKLNYLTAELRCFSKGDIVEYSIYFVLRSLYQPTNMKKGDTILLKTFDGDITETTLDYVSEKYDPFINSVTYTSTDQYWVTFSIVLDDAVINTLLNGVSKIRLQVYQDIADFNLKKDNISQFILDEYNQMEQALIKKRNFKEGF